MTLSIGVGNGGDPFVAEIRVRESRGGAETLFHGSGPRELARGSNAFDIPIAPGDASAGTTLEIVDLSDSDKVVFRSALSRILRPLARAERLFVTVGAMPAPFRMDEGARVWAMEPGDMPTGREAYGPVDALVVGSAPRSSLSTAQLRAASDYVLGGGRIVFTSTRAFEPFATAILGENARAPRNPGELMAALPSARIRSGTEAEPRVIEFPLGLGRCAVVAGRPDGESTSLPEDIAKDLSKLLGEGRTDPFLAPPRAGALVDAAAFGALGPGRPFARASARARTVAIVGALLVTVCAVLVAGRRGAIAGVVLGGAVAGWALVALLAWQEPVAAARVVRVRAMSADGRAEAVTDTAVFVVFDRDATLSLETPTGPPLPLARRPGSAFDEPFELRAPTGGAGAWSLSSLKVSPTGPYLVRATAARAVGADGGALRERVLVDGARLRVTTLPGGARKLSGADDLPRDVRYLLERFAPPCDTLAWSWFEGAPEGISARGCDVAPGSGMLIVAGSPTVKASD